MSAPGNAPAFYISPPHACGYLEERSAVTLFLDPAAPVTVPFYTRLAHYGFRRSGTHLYRPRCPGCKACVPVRIPVDAFRPNRSQRRSERRNADLRCALAPFAFDDAQFDLYARYVAWRHAGSSMDDPNPEHYLACFDSPWADTLALTWHVGDDLVAVAIVDRLGDALSAVYTFFAPEAAKRGLGTLAILRQVDLARDAGLDWVYLGYWIGASDKMRYKSGFRPLEWFDDGRWRRLEVGAGEPG